ncbi:ATPase [Lentibacillus salinarum]|uniref:ATPase n=1 Tax=Lentibacillus salinarum TaxID=446820 RepID=A0ABW3ZT50_9BACI
MSDFVLPVLITLFVVIILSIIFKGKDKVDRGFKINYFKLSYRRKMIRTIIFIPINILLLIFIYAYTDWSMLVNVFLGLLLLIAILVQLIYNFNMWKKTENS